MATAEQIENARVAVGGGVGSGSQESRPTDVLFDSGYAARGILGETVPVMSLTAAIQFASGTMRGSYVALRAGQVVSNLTCQVGNPGTSMSHFWMAIFDSNYILLGQTADSPTSVQSGANVTLPLVTPVVLSRTGPYYLATLGTTTGTMPTLASGGSTSSFSGLGEAVGSGLRVGWQQTGLVAVPNPAVPASSGAFVWVAAS